LRSSTLPDKVCAGTQFYVGRSLTAYRIEDYATLRNLWVTCARLSCHNHVHSVLTFTLNRRNCHGFILVYSITSRSSFERVERYYQDMVRTKRGAPKFILVGNKVDKLNQREVTSDEGFALARQYGCRFFETSAKTRVNVEEAFTCLVRTLRDSETTKPETPTGVPPRAGGGRVKGEKKGWKKCVIL
jgi:hypothetical protein